MVECIARWHDFSKDKWGGGGGGVQGGKINNVLFVQAPLDFQCVSCHSTYALGL